MHSHYPTSLMMAGPLPCLLGRPPLALSTDPDFRFFDSFALEVDNPDRVYWGIMFTHGSVWQKEVLLTGSPTGAEQSCLSGWGGMAAPSRFLNHASRLLALAFAPGSLCNAGTAAYCARNIPPVAVLLLSPP